MYIPKFALREKERLILSKYLNRSVTITLKEKLEAYVIDDKQFEEMLEFVYQFREGEAVNEAGAPSAIPNSNRSGVIRAVTTVFNMIVDAQKIKNPDIRISAMASIMASVMSIFTVSPEYGQRLISILKSKV